MTGYIYEVDTRRIVTKIDNVVECDELNIIGGASRAKVGTGEYIISDLDFSEGDILPEEINDKRKLFVSQ